MQIHRVCRKDIGYLFEECQVFYVIQCQVFQSVFGKKKVARYVRIDYEI